MNKRKIKKAIKRLRFLPKNKFFFLYAGNKLKQAWLKFIKSTKVAYPSTIMLELNNHCNLHCTTCPREYDYGRAMDKGFITVQQAIGIVDELWPYLDSIGLTGMGETFLFKEIETIVDYIKDRNKGIIVSLSTNAMLPDFAALSSNVVNKVDTIQVSIDGLGETYELIRNNASFNILDKNLDVLVELCRNTETSVILNMVVTRENYCQMSDLIQFASKKGIEYLNFTLLNLGSITNISSEYYHFFQTTEFLDELKKAKFTEKQFPNVEVTFWDYKSKNEFQKCLFPWTHFYICWNGFLTPCCSKPFPKELNFGNVFEQGVMPVLNGSSFRQFRKMWYLNQTHRFCNKCHFIELEPIHLQ